MLLVCKMPRKTKKRSLIFSQASGKRFAGCLSLQKTTNFRMQDASYSKKVPKNGLRNTSYL